MKEPKNHLNIDFGFLDKKQPARDVSSKAMADQGTPTSEYYEQNRAKPSSGKKHNLKNILIVSGVILFFGWAIFSSEDQSSPSTNSTNTSTHNNFTTGTGQVFSCSGSNYYTAGQLKPDESISASLAIESTALDNRAKVLEAQQKNINLMYVDETSQFSIDNYNAAVDDFNSRNSSLKLDITAWNEKSSAQNKRIDTFNNFLDNNCTPQ